jgi:hypothetical protein
MNTAFDDVVSSISERGFHNHRLEGHSAAMSRGILRDVRAICQPLEDAFASERLGEWLDYPSPAGRARKLDLAVAEPIQESGLPDLASLRLCIENKSVVTAHRNRTNRYDDLSDLLGVLHRNKPEAILVATVLVGLCDRVLNVPDRIKPFVSEQGFVHDVLPRLSTGDQQLWIDFPAAISRNRPTDPELTIRKFKELPIRPPGRTDMVAFDYVLLVPMLIDNVNPPSVARSNALGIDVDADYQAMLDQICRAYTARWHI